MSIKRKNEKKLFTSYVDCIDFQNSVATLFYQGLEPVVSIDGLRYVGDHKFGECSTPITAVIDQAQMIARDRPRRDGLAI